MALAPINSFYLTWWYTPTTKLGIFFNDFSLTANTEVLTVNTGFDSTNGISYANGLGASIEEDYHFENQITRHPVESDQMISDHIIPQPRMITITGLLTSIKPALVFGHLDFNQLGQATQILISLYEQRTGISLLTGLLYGKSFLRVDNLAVRSLDIPRNNQYGRSSIKFTMILEQLILTSQNGNITSAGYSNASVTDGVDIL